ncbi:SAM-dependent methyltransferase [Aliidongia dinghuensis]|uniref:SAM-dependent methyltransferase n=1 Tax=Aliidongia dinghuensis TaxID=1867774 RepID=A0A8J2YPD9_9PROT|nr:class I SAM-dependent methyltransferase [Aliidongia dinghuensis]GGF00086.1 SAM-dependent methyltransferase [Aliidongia dinghuensis]
MDRIEYEKMHAVEERMWWYRGLHANLLTVFRRAGRVRPGSKVLDAGCGTGGFLAKLGQAQPALDRIGMDLDPVAAELAAARAAIPVCVGSINALPFATDSLGTIFSADVLYHRAVDETQALADLHRCLEPGGALLLNLPAYDWMFSAHDRAVHTARRYTATRIRTRLRAAGFAQVHTTYWNSLLFPLMVLRRKLVKTEGAASDVALLPAPIEFLFRSAMGIENLLLRCGIALPFGGSVLAVAIKHG